MDDKSKIGLPHPLFLLGRPQFDGDMGKMGGCIASKSTDAADEIKQLRARNQELEAMLDAVGAGGVSAQRITQAADHIAQDRKMVAAQEPFGYFKAEPFGWRDCAETDEGAIALYEAPQPQADARDATQIITRPAAAQKIPRDPIPTVDTWETCTIKEAKELNPALWRVRMLYPQEAIDAAIAKATGRADSGDGSQKDKP